MFRHALGICSFHASPLCWIHCSVLGCRHPKQCFSECLFEVEDGKRRRGQCRGQYFSTWWGCVCTLKRVGFQCFPGPRHWWQGEPGIVKRRNANSKQKRGEGRSLCDPFLKCNLRDGVVCQRCVEGKTWPLETYTAQMSPHWIMSVESWWVETGNSFFGQRCECRNA